MMFGVWEILAWGLPGLKEIQNAPKAAKNHTFRAKTITYHILLNLRRKLNLSNTYTTWSGLNLEKFIIALQLQVPKKAPCEDEISLVGINWQKFQATGYKKCLI